MTPEREHIIKSHWWAIGSRYGWNFRDNPRLRIAVRQFRIRPRIEPDWDSIPEPDVLTYEFERGQYDGQPAARIVCEGVVLDMVVR